MGIGQPVRLAQANRLSGFCPGIAILKPAFGERSAALGLLSCGQTRSTYHRPVSVKAIHAAKYLLSKVDPEAGDTISNLKLQKLLYYAQGLFLAKHGRPLFNEPVEAWTHGPVVPAVYHFFKNFGDQGLPRPHGIPALLKQERDFLDHIYRIYGQYSGWKLRNFTHDEPPWRNTPDGGTISHAALASYFKTQL